ncbi:helix-turn-helix domain-containing protein [Spirosoma sp. KUDC1026]|uniref:helix-turn-helix domain-containing protein n=1 Tax=Spirosoma sp. KUDC1026 TaxID=2745947 RepID=UPI00159BC798|nr:helix-turn-helix domain-containing protein [Spirosoma sp. KUDC1026]QKZ13219.1 helix-turn-helix domain-containing protein [Spirosoma sp. KUDC1026]
MKIDRCGLILAFFILTLTSWGQIRLEVARPTSLPLADSSLYIVGSFNNWNPGDPRFLLTPQANGSYVILLPDTLRRFEYKFTQGSWQFTEGNTQGESIPNRLYDRTQTKTPQRIQVTVAGWEQRPAYHFVVTELPVNTPQDATLYITGTFNKWNPGDPRYKLRRQPDGTYRVTVYSDLPRLEYKFTRGNWASVEGRDNGKSRPNRRIARAESRNLDIDVRIGGWEDLTSSFQFYSAFDLVMLFSVVLAALLIVSLPVRTAPNRAANRWLITLVTFSAVFTLLKVISSYRDIANAYPKLLLLPDFIWFLYAPLFYFYLRRRLFNKPLPKRGWVYSFIPVVVQFFAYLPYFLMESKVFQLKLVNQDTTLRMLFLALGFLALVFNIGYWLAGRRLIQAFKTQVLATNSSGAAARYMNAVLVIQATCLTLWLFLYGITAASRIIDVDIVAIAEQNVDMIWLVFSLLTYLLSFAALRQSAIVQLPPVSPPVVAATPDDTVAPVRVTPVPIDTVSNMPADDTTEQLLERLPESTTQTQSLAKPVAPSIDVQVFLEMIETYMDQQKPYTNPNLTIHELAAGLKMPSHLLSRVINEGFGKNFFDFVNQYRVDELKRRMNDPHARGFTLLSLAFDVGFNSKTAFNRAFKKLTHQTPKEYFQMTSDEHPA